jgi:hypothetical protein
MQLHLDEIATKITPGAHAILILDQAGWHGAKDLKPHLTPAAAAALSGAQSPGKHLADRMFVPVRRWLVHAMRRARIASDRPASSLTHRGRAMQQNIRVFVGLDTSKNKISVALAEDGRRGEVRFFGDIDNNPDAVKRLVSKLSGKYNSCCFVTKRVRLAMAYIARLLLSGMIVPLSHLP